MAVIQPRRQQRQCQVLQIMLLATQICVVAIRSKAIAWAEDDISLGAVYTELLLKLAVCHGNACSLELAELTCAACKTVLTLW